MDESSRPANPNTWWTGNDADQSQDDRHGGDHDHGGHVADDHDHHPPPRPLARIAAILRPEWPDIRLVVVFSLAVGLLSLATPIAVQALVDNIQFGVMFQPLIFLTLAVLLCLGLAALLLAVEAYLVEYLTQRLFVRQTAAFADRLTRVRAEVLDGLDGAERVNRFFDVLKVQKAVAVLLADGVNTAIAVGVGLLVLALYHVYLLGFGVILVGLMLFLFLVLGRGGVRTGLHESHAKYELVGWLEEVARRPRAYKCGGGTAFARRRADALTGAWVAGRSAHFGVWFRQFAFALFIYVTASGALLGLGGYLVIQRQLTFGQLVAAELIVGLVVASFLKFGKYLDAWYDLCVGVEKLALVTDLPAERPTGVALPQAAAGIELHVAGAGYSPHGSDWLAATTFHVKPNARVALTGPGGAGKSVLLELLAGLREPTTGHVAWDDIDLRDLNLTDARRQVALVTGPDLFAGTVRDNLLVGREDRTAADVARALGAVGLKDVVYRLTAGTHSVVASNGSPLTPSQATRLTIARAVLGRPRLLLLDGVLDHLHPADAPNLLDALFDPAAPWTLVVVTRDPDVLARCDDAVPVGDPDPGIGRRTLAHRNGHP